MTCLTPLPRLHEPDGLALLPWAAAVPAPTAHASAAASPSAAVRAFIPISLPLVGPLPAATVRLRAPQGNGCSRCRYGLGGLVARDGETHQQRHVDRVDDKRERE